MNINERIRLVRQSDKLNKKEKMTMERFGARLGVSKMAISNIEAGNRNITDQMFKSICREFDVNPEWLQNGTGPMFKEEERNELIQKFISDILKDEPDGIKARLVSVLARLDDDDWIRIADALNYIAPAAGAKKEEDYKEMNRDDLHAELDRQLDQELEVEEKSKVL